MALTTGNGLSRKRRLVEAEFRGLMWENATSEKERPLWGTEMHAILSRIVDKQQFSEFG
jgi:hypothetical protein